MLSVGTILQKHYRVEGLLGRCRTGNVYLATHLRLWRPVAVKQLYVGVQDPQQDARALERLRDEARVLQRLDHPSLPTVHDLVELHGDIFLILQYVDGRSLEVLRQAVGQLPAEQILGWAMALCDVLEYLHGQEPPVLFRELRPANVLLDVQGRIRLTDYGTPVLGGVDPDQAFQASSALGYTAPGQYAGPPDVRDDIYSIGATLFFLLTGTAPPASPEFLVGAVDLPSIQRLRPDVGSALCNMVSQCLQVSARDRPADVKRLRQMLVEASRSPAPAVAPSASLDRTEALVEPSLAPAAPRGDPGPDLSGLPPVEICEPSVVGRNAQWEALQLALAEARGGQQRFVLLRGEAGVGKTRLLEEFVRRVPDTGVEALMSRCCQQEATPFHAVTPWLRHLVKNPGPAPGPLGPGFVTGLFGSSPSTDGTGRYRLFELASRQIRAALQAGPCLLVVEDLQWADPNSLALLEYLVASLTQQQPPPTHGAVIVATLRPGNAPPTLVKWLHSLTGWDWCYDVPLGCLSLSDVQTMIGSMLGGPVASSVGEEIHRETSGNPLFVRELVKSLVAQGALQFLADHWQGRNRSPDRATTPAPGPSTVQEVLGARLQRLTLAQREILAYASVLGQTFSLEQLHAAIAMEPGRLGEGIHFLLQERIIAEVPESGQSQFTFDNSKIREVVLNSLNATQLRDIHLKVGMALEEHQKSRPTASAVFVLAKHFAQAGVWYRAKPFLLAAGEQAAQAFAFLQAAEYYSQLLEGHRSDPILDADELLEVREALADALNAGGKHTEAIEIYADLLLNAGSVPARELRLGRLQRKLARAHHNAGNYQASLEHLDAALAAMGISVPKAGVSSYLHLFENMVRSSTALANRAFVEDAQRAREILESCQGIVESVYFMDAGRNYTLLKNAVLIYKQVATQGREEADVATAECFVAHLHCLDNPPNGRKVQASLQKTLEVLQRLPDAPRKAGLLRECGMLYYLMGYYSEALLFSSQARELALEIGDVVELAWSCVAESHVHWRQGELEKARQLVNQAIQLSTATGMQSVWVVSNLLLVRQLISTGELGLGTSALEKVRGQAPGGTQRYEDLLSDLCVGMVWRRQGRLSDAAALLKQTMERLLEALCGTTYVLEAGEELAETLFQQALSGGYATALGDLDKVLKKMGRLVRDLPLHRGTWLRLRGQFFSLKGQMADAMEHFQQSQAVLQKGGYGLGLAVTYEAIGDALERASPGDGRPYFRRAAMQFEELGATAMVSDKHSVVAGTDRSRR